MATKLSKKIIKEILKNSFLFGKVLVKRKGPPPKIRKWIEQNRNKHITKIVVCRKPVQKAVRNLLNIVSLGKFDKSLKGLNYENIFHLYIYITIGNKTWRIEKNEVVDLTEDNRDINEDCMNINLEGKTITKRERIKPRVQRGLFFSSGPKFKTTITRIPRKKITLERFMKNGENFQNNFWDYVPKDNNCQVFAISLLLGNGLIKRFDKTYKFVKQDSEAIFRNNPRYLAKVGKTFTDIAAVFDALKEGK